jgi:putative copper export protein
MRRSFGDRYPQGAELTHPVLNEYSQTDLLNRRFRRVTWVLLAVLLSVLALLVLELTGILPISPFQPGLKVTDRPALPAKH